MSLIRIGGLGIRFLQDRHGTDGRLDLFEMTAQPRADMPVAHYHADWDETVYGLAGVTTWRIDGRDLPLGPGQSAFIPRGVVHGFRNEGELPSRCLCALTPGALGPEYFDEMGRLLQSSPGDKSAMAALMHRYGLIPASNG